MKNNDTRAARWLSIFSLILTATLAANSPSGIAQQAPPNASSTLLEEVVVTARKREEPLLDVPIAITALNSDQLDVLKVRDIQSLSTGLPNVALDDVGTTRGIANFSIRGLGINSSIPSIDPTVGTFVDGVYLGTNTGVVFDIFELENVEVLRGPQGTLFGRNVTGGAVLLNSKKPSEEFEATIKGSIEGGGEKTNQYLMGSAGGSINNSFAAKISFYTNQDNGYFLNLNTNQAFGQQDTISVRPVIVWTPNNSFSFTAIYDYFNSSGDGPAAQNHRNGIGITNQLTDFDRNGFDFSIDEEGYLETRSDFLRTITELELGGGTLTNVFGYRQLEQTGLIDVDATPVSLFHSITAVDAEQISNELRWAGDTGERSKLTVGAYYFKNEILYNENRRLLGFVAPPGFFGLTLDGGGDYQVETLGVFASLDYELNDSLTLNAGIRYTDEKKSAGIASLIRNLNSPCSVLDGQCPIDFIDNGSWDNLSPKVGLTYHIGDNSMAYGHWTRGFRSGGYNLRNTAIDTASFGPGPFDEETVENLEVGFKTKLANGGRLSGALFYNQVDDLQREINLADPISGVVQVIRNTADASILGVEFDGLFPLSDALILNATVGYIDPQYDSVRFDINGDGVVNNTDTELDLPRAAKLTYSVGLTLDSDVGSWGSIISRVSYGFRDESASTDNNLGFISKQGVLDLGVDLLSADGIWKFGFYGKNLSDEVKHGGDTQLPSFLGPVPLGGTFSPLAKGRIYGAELTLNF